jgi:hypothetical protein
MADGTLAGQDPVATLANADLFYVDDGPGVDAKCTGTVLKAFTSASPTLVTPDLGVPSAGDISACTGGPTLTSATLVTPALGTPASGDISACTSTSMELVTPVLGTVTSGDISACSSTSLTMVTPVLGTPTSGDISNCTGSPALTALSLTALLTRSVTAAITADTGSSQGDGALITDINQISTCANAGDAVTLPDAVAGYTVTIINNGAEACDVFPAASDDCGGGVDTAVSLAAAANITYVSIDATTWVPVT